MDDFLPESFELDISIEPQVDNAQNNLTEEDGITFRSPRISVVKKGKDNKG